MSLFVEPVSIYIPDNEIDISHLSRHIFYGVFNTLDSSIPLAVFALESHAEEYRDNANRIINEEEM